MRRTEMSRSMLPLARMMYVVERFMINWCLDAKASSPRFRSPLRRPTSAISSRPPVAWTIKGVHADAVELAHFADPPRMHPTGVVVGRLADIVEPELAVQCLASDGLG